MKLLILMISLVLCSTSFAMSKKPKEVKQEEQGKAMSMADKVNAEYEAKFRKDLDRSCKSDSDCIPTCMFGGVSKAWAEKHKTDFNDCADGCTGFGQKIKCMDNQCRTLGKGGKVDMESGCNK